MWKKTSIRFRFNFIACVLVFACGLSIISINTSISRDALESEIRSNTMPSMVQGISAMVEILLASPAKTLKALGGHPMFVDWVVNGEDPAALHKIADFSRQFLAANDTLSITIVLKKSGTFYTITEDALEIKPVDPVIDAWFPDFEQRNVPVFVNIHGPNDPVYASLAFINTRMEDTQGNFIGSFATAISAKELFENLGGLRIGSRGATFVVRSDGTILLHPDPDMMGKHLDSLQGIGTYTGTIFSDETITFDAIGPTGESLLFIGHPVPLLDAMAFTQVNLDEMLAPIDRVRNYSLLICLAVMPVGFILCSTLATTITRSLRRAVVFAGNVARGQAVNELAIPESEEMAELARALNSMQRELLQSSVSIGSLQGILNGMDALLYVTDPETDKILFINDQMCAHFGLEGDIAGEVCWKVLQTGMESRCPFCPVFALQEGGKKLVKWEEHNTVTERYYSNTDCLIKWANGEMVHLQHSVDITERKLAEEDVKRQFEQQTLLSTMSQSLISSSSESELIGGALSMMGKFNNASHAYLVQLSPDSQTLVVKHQWHNPLQDVPCFEGVVIPFHQGSAFRESISPTTTTYYACNGTTGDIFSSDWENPGVKSFLAVPVIVSGGLWGFLCMDDWQNIRSLTTSEAHLMKLVGNMLAGVIFRSVAEDKLMRMSMLVESAPQYISYVDMQGKFLYVNRGATAMLGYTEEEFLAGGYALLFGEEALLEAQKTTLPEVLAKGITHLELTARHKDGSERILTLSAFSTPHTDHGIGAIALDVTEHRMLEKEILKAKEQAERSNSAKSEFLSRMSHEMRTPLNAIIGMTAIAQGSGDMEKKEYCLERISNASNHLLGVINDILDMSKIEANKFELSTTEFIFSKMLARIYDVVNFKVAEKSQKLHTSIGPGVPFSLVADEQRLGQVIANLLSNAVKFTPTGGSIEVNSHILSSSGAECLIEIEVKDSGIGISAEDQTKLFRAFEQADGSISRKFGGTGLGLAISKRIVELMGGTVRVQSTLGQGASFIFTIRAKRGSLTLEKFVPKTAPWRQVPMLLISQTPAICTQFVEIAKVSRCHLDYAADMAEAHACFEKLQASGLEGYSIIWIEHAFPHTDGLAIAREIRSHCSNGPHLVIVSTDDEVAIQDATGDGMADKLMLPPFFSYMIAEYLAEISTTAISQAQAETVADAPSFAGRHVLLAEDVDLNREVLMALLEDTGLVFECAENGQEAIDKFAADPDRYDLIFMDIHMPDVDGYQATRQIRRLPLTRATTIPIIAMTANVFKEDVDRCLAAGMNDHLGKPIDKDEILSRLEKYLWNNQSG